MSEIRLTHSDLLTVEKSAAEDFARCAAYAAFQQPAAGAAQLCDKITGSDLAKHTKFAPPCKEADFGSARWHVQSAGSALGTLAPFVGSMLVSRKILGTNALHAAGDKVALGLTMREAALAGFLNDSIFRPVDPSKGFWQERLINGGTGALNFTALTVTARGVAKLGEYRPLGALSNPVVNGLISGLPAGALAANLESIHQHGRFANSKETGRSMYQMSFAGGLLGFKQQLLQPPPSSLEAGLPKTDVIKIVVSSKQTVDRSESPPLPEPAKAGDGNKPSDKKTPPPLPKEENLPIADEIVELEMIRPPRVRLPKAPEKEVAPKIEKTEPPLQGFFSKETHYRGIPIRSADCVSDAALVEAHRRIAMMLDNAPEVVERLYQAGAEFHIIGKNQAVSDLPDLRGYKGKPFDGDQTIDQRTRGVGGLYSSCGEENLLKLPGDKYAGRDICCHEFAHTIHFYGLPPEVVARVKERFEKAKTEGKWTGAYALKNEKEYFAELSMWYFGGQGDPGAISPTPKAGREWLRQYDPEGYNLLHSIYKRP